MYSLEKKVLFSLLLDGGIYVTAPTLAEAFFAAVRKATGGRHVELVFVDEHDVKELHQRLASSAKAGHIVVLAGRRSFPDHLAHITWVFCKGDGLVTPEGLTTKGASAPSFRLLCWMTPEAWRLIDANLRVRLLQTIRSSLHCYLESAAESNSILELEGKRLATKKNPAAALRAAGSFEERRRILIELFPPRSPNGNFEGHDKAMLVLMDELNTSADETVQQDLLAVFALHGELYLASEALGREWAYREATLARLAQTVEQTPYIGGQRQYFWTLVKELAERGEPAIKRFINTQLKDGNAQVPALSVLAQMRPWLELMEPVIALLRRSADLAVHDLVRQILCTADRVGLLQQPALADKVFGRPPQRDRVCGMPIDDYEYYMEVARSRTDATQFAKFSDDLRLLARFQARIQSLPVDTYPRSILTFERAVKTLIIWGSAAETIENNHLASVRTEPREHQLLTQAWREARG